MRVHIYMCDNTFPELHRVRHGLMTHVLSFLFRCRTTSRVWCTGNRFPLCGLWQMKREMFHNPFIAKERQLKLECSHTMQTTLLCVVTEIKRVYVCTIGETRSWRTWWQRSQSHNCWVVLSLMTSLKNPPGTYERNYICHTKKTARSVCTHIDT